MHRQKLVIRCQMRRWTTSLPMPSTYFELVMRAFGGAPGIDTVLREGTGVTSEVPGAEITLGQQLVQVRNANRLFAPGWGLKLGRRFEPSTHGPVGFAALSAPTLGDGLAVVERFGHVRSPYFQFGSSRDARRFALRVEERVSLAVDERIPLIECVMLSLQKLVEPVLGEPMSAAEFHFAWAPPPYADRYRECFHGPVRFHARHTEVAMPSQWLALKCPMADPVTYNDSMRTLEALERRLDGDAYVAAQVEQLIAASRGSGPSLAEAAARLHLSCRTLIRRLRGAGTTYHELIDTQQRDRAETLLANPDFDIAEIGHRLGYRDPANFGRAARRWFGMAPGRYRRLLTQRPA